MSSNGFAIASVNHSMRHFVDLRSIFRVRAHAWLLVAITCMLAACENHDGQHDNASQPGSTDSRVTGNRDAIDSKKEESDSAAACTNAADFRPGTRLDVEYRETLTTGAVSTIRQIVTSGDRKPFAGANPFSASVVLIQQGGGAYPPSLQYRDLVERRSVIYGSQPTSSGDMLVTFKPGLAIPIDLKPGEFSESSYEVITQNGPQRMTRHAFQKTTYVGREMLETTVGTFSTCHFRGLGGEGRSAAEADGHGLIQDLWIAATGPYRGQSLKVLIPAQGDQPGRVTETIKIEYVAAASPES